jgi:CHAD domain-containing protein
MLTLNPPRAVLRQEIAELVGCADGLRHADPESVHQARVASRRIREILPLFAGAHPDAAATLQALLKKLGRWLGAVRELDVTTELIDRESQRLPFAAPVFARLRIMLASERPKAQRRLIKRLERVGLLRQARPIADGAWSAVGDGIMAPRSWTATLRDRVHDRLVNLDNALQGMAGVYFPNRTHKTRIAVKQLRYSLELAHAAGVWRIPATLKVLRRVQGKLGDLHDLQVLIDRLDASDGDATPSPDTVAARQALQAEVETQYRRYLKRQESLQSVRDECARLMRPHPLRRSSLLLAAAAIPTALVLARK